MNFNYRIDDLLQDQFMEWYTRRVKICADKANLYEAPGSDEKLEEFDKLADHEYNINLLWLLDEYDGFTAQYLNWYKAEYERKNGKPYRIDIVRSNYDNYYYKTANRYEPDEAEARKQERALLLSVFDYELSPFWDSVKTLEKRRAFDAAKKNKVNR